MKIARLLPIVLTMVGCGMSVDSSTHPPIVTHMPVVRQVIVRTDTVYITEVSRPSRLRRVAQVATLVLAVYGANKLGIRHLKWHRNTAGRIAAPFVERKQ